MKFREIPYTRPDLEQMKQQLEQLTGRLLSAKAYPEARQTFLDREAFCSHIGTLATLANVRHSIDTRDVFYDEEVKFWNNASPELEQYHQAWSDAMLESPFRSDFAAEYGDLMFCSALIRKKTFSPEIIPELQQENDLVQTYEKLLASARVSFEGSTYTLAQMTPFKKDADDARRLAAWKAEGSWYRENRQQLDQLYGDLVRLRDTMGRKLGYDGYTRLGYYRMNRNCYTKEDVEVFRHAVRAHLVPVADQIFRMQAERLGKEYPMNFADCALEFRSGNPAPRGSARDILDHGLRFYEALSPETGEFFRTMLDGELMDVLAAEGKAGGGYCTGLTEYRLPFIFANFNGTQGDVEVITHEAGHAFAFWMNRDRVPEEYQWPSLEGCEVHSMSMEFFAWPWAEGFFGEDTEKFYYSHLAGALTFIPYGTMVDHFQHVIYEKPCLTPEERHQVWRQLLADYMPWIRLDGEIPFYSDGCGWQRQSHIYSSPFYYIDYCLAQTVALQFWKQIQTDREAAWQRYMAYTKQGGSRTFTCLLENAGLDSPFREDCLRSVCHAARSWLEKFPAERLV